MAGTESEERKHIPTHTQRSHSVDHDKQTKEFEQRAKQLRMDFAITFGTPEGRRVLQWILKEAGYQRSQVGGNPQLGMDVLQGTLYNSARLSIYLEMRQLIPPETLKGVEYEHIDEILS